MNAMTRMWLGVGGLAVTVVAVAAFGLRSVQRDWWTDGGAIKHSAAGAPLRQILWTPAEPLPGSAGRSSDEYEPRYSADGTTLVFVRGRPGHNADLYTSRWTPAGWSNPAPIDSVNTEHDELGPELSRDGTALYFYSDRPGGFGGYDLWVSRAEDGGWGPPTNLGAAINSAWNEYGPALSPSGDVLYFSSNRSRPGETATAPETWSATVRERRTRHDYDLYYARMHDGTADAARPATALNTPDDEGAPALSPAGDFVYFASDRAGGLGGFDLYRARTARDGEPRAPENLGSAVNSPFNDLDPALTSDGFRLCFSSDRQSTPREPEPGALEVPSSAQTPRYALWSSVSREVFRTSESSPNLLAWSWLKWLLLLLLTLVPIFLLLYLIRSELWRRRFGTLGLVARCLIVSLLIHAMLASLFSVWRIGTGMIDLLQQGGGTRIVITSGASGESAAGGSIVTQIRGLALSGSSPIAELTPLAATVETPVSDAPTIQPSLPELVAPAAPALAATGETRPEPSISASPSPVAPVTAGSVAESTLPAAAAREQGPKEPVVQAELANQNSPPAPGAQATPAVKPSQVAIELPQLDAPGDRAAPLREPPPMPARAERAAATPPAQAASLALGVSPAAQDTKLPSLPASAAAAQPEAGRPSADRLADAAPLGAQPLARNAPVAGTAARVELSLQSIAGAGQTGAAGGVLSPSVPESPRAERLTSASPSALAPGAGPGTGIEPNIPKVAAAQASGSPEAVVPSSSVSSAVSGSDAPAAPTAMIGAPGDKPGTGPGSGIVMIEPGRSATGPDSRERSALVGLPESDVARPRAASAGSAPPAPLPTPAWAADGDARLPTAPVTPVETFAQRAPEVRDELVEQMGGSPETERAVGLALEWFARHQSPGGQWSAQHYDDGCGRCAGAAEVKADTAMTGMALLCYLGAGHTHQKNGPYQGNVNRALAWLIARQTADGDLRAGETMYGQTVATVALCEALAMTRDPALTLPAQRAVSFVLARATGDQRKSDRDTSVIGWLVFTVESARRAGISVPRTTFDTASAWLDQVAVPGSPGEYAYARGKPASAAMTAEAMFIRQLLGHTREEVMMNRSAQFILGAPPKWRQGAPTFYWYYATLALFQHQGDAWKEWNGALVRELLAHQQQDGPSAGSWDPTDEWSRLGGRVYQTAVCTLSLEVYYRYRADVKSPSEGKPAR